MILALSACGAFVATNYYQSRYLKANVSQVENNDKLINASVRDYSPSDRNNLIAVRKRRILHVLCQTKKFFIVIDNKYC